MFRAHVLIIRRSKLHYTASGWERTAVLSQPVHETATYRCDDTRGCVMQFWPRDDDEHMCSKHVEAWNKLIVKQKFCASSWLISEINTLRCTVSKTSKKKKKSMLFSHVTQDALIKIACFFSPQSNAIHHFRILYLVQLVSSHLISSCPMLLIICRNIREH